MNECSSSVNLVEDCIDVEALDYSDDQTCLLKLDDSSIDNEVVLNDLVWPDVGTTDYEQEKREFLNRLDGILGGGAIAGDIERKFDSRTFIRPKKRYQRPSIENVLEGVGSKHTNRLDNIGENEQKCHTAVNRSLTYNKYASNLSPMLRLKTFNVEVGSDNSSAIKDYAERTRRRSNHSDIDLIDDPELTLSNTVLSENTSMTKPINIDLSQPAHNLHTTFSRLMSNDRSFSMLRSGDNFMNMSPPSLVNSMVMDYSGNFEELKKSISGQTGATRESMDPHSMISSITLSILDEKDMSTSFLSQSTGQDYDSLSSMPPSLVSSLNSSFNLLKKPEDSGTLSNLLEPSERLMNRPRCPLYKSFTKEEKNNIMNATVDLDKNCLNDNMEFEKDGAFHHDVDLIEMGRNSLNITLDKKELNEIIQARQKLSLARNNLPKKQLNDTYIPAEIAQKQNLFGRTINLDDSINETVQVQNQIIKLPRKSLENASELLSRRKQEDSPIKNGTYRKMSPGKIGMQSTMVLVKNSDTLEPENHVDPDSTLRHDKWKEERGMGGSTDSTEDASSSASPPHDTVYTNAALQHQRLLQVVSTPLSNVRSHKKTNDLLLIQNTISPILDTTTRTNLDQYDKGDRTLRKSPPYDNKRRSPISNAVERSRGQSNEFGDKFIRKSPVLESVDKATRRLYDSGNKISKPLPVYDMARSPLSDITSDKIAPVKSPQKTESPSKINTATIVRRQHIRRDIDIKSPEKAKPGIGLVVSNLPKKSNLPTSKLRQYSSHRDLSRVQGGALSKVRAGGVVYASNPALSPTSQGPQLLRRDSYTIATHETAESSVKQQQGTKPAQLVRQGTETFKRPQSQLITPKEIHLVECANTTSTAGAPGAINTATILRNKSHLQAQRPNSIASTHQLQRIRQSTSAIQKPIPVSANIPDKRPSTSVDVRNSYILQRPSRLPAPRSRGLRPPSVYSVAPGDMDNY